MHYFWVLCLVYGCNGGCSAVGCMGSLQVGYSRIDHLSSSVHYLGQGIKLIHYVSECRGKLGIHRSGVGFTRLLQDKVHPYQLACTKGALMKVGRQL